MGLRCAGFVALSALVASSAVPQPDRPPESLVPKQALVTLRIESPPVLDAPSFLPQLAGLYGLEMIEGVDAERPWYAFGIIDAGHLGPWVLLPIAERAMFDASVVGMPEGIGVIVARDHALMGPRPFPAGGGVLPAQLGDANASLDAQSAAIYRLFADDIEMAAVLTELARERAESEAAREEYQPPVHWDEVRERVLSQNSTLYEVLGQTERTTLTIDRSSDDLRVAIEIRFAPGSDVATLVASQEPRQPSRLKVFPDSSFFRQWTHFRLTGAATLEPQVELIAEVTGFSKELFKELVLNDAESWMAVSSGRGRVVTETVYRPTNRDIQDYRRIVTALHAESSTPETLGVQSVFEPEIARAGGLPVDRLVEYLAGDSPDASVPWAQSYFAWDDDMLYASTIAGAGTDEAFSRLTNLVGRSQDGVPDTIRPRLANAPRELLYLSWFDLEAWDRAQVGGLIEPMTVSSKTPAWLAHATSEETAIRLGATIDVAQMQALTARQREIQTAAESLFQEGLALTHGIDVPEDVRAGLVSLEKAAALGNDEAMYAVGLQYASGSGVEKNDSEALRWFELAASLGNTDAMVEAGHSYYYGRGRGVDHTSAFSRYHSGAQLGNADAQFYVGLLIESGHGVERDFTSATEWYELAAEQGHAGAQKSAARMYFYGRGVDVDRREAERWYRMAANNGDTESMRLLALTLRVIAPDGVSTEALDWLQRGTDAGDIEATYELAQLYLLGIIVETDFDRAHELYRLVADDTESPHRAKALYQLARAHQFGRGSYEQDFTRSAKLMLASAEAGYLYARTGIAEHYFNGLGVERDDGEAVKWLRLSADEDREAAYFLAGAYEDARGLERNLDEAMKWHRKSAEAGYARAQWVLGAHYEQGVGVESDPSEAARWYRRAAEQGFVEGQYNLGRLYLMGLGVEQDLVESYVWFALAIQSSPYEDYRKHTESMLATVEGQLVPAELARAKERVASFTPKREPTR